MSGEVGKSPAVATVTPRQAARRGQKRGIVTNPLCQARSRAASRFESGRPARHPLRCADRGRALAPTRRYFPQL